MGGASPTFFRVGACAAGSSFLGYLRNIEHALGQLVWEENVALRLWAET